MFYVVLVMLLSVMAAVVKRAPKDTLFRDISYYNKITIQAIVRAGYRVVSIRSNDGTFRDPDFHVRMAAAKQAADRGDFTCWGLYYVPENDWLASVQTMKAMVGKPHRRMFVIMDVERWGGKITGDHSAQFDAARKQIIAWLRASRGPVARKVDMILRRQPRRVLVYGNVGDLQTLYPRRPRGLRYIIAAYGSNPSFPGKIAHQFGSDYAADGLPAGDINSADGLTPDQFARAVGCQVLNAKQRTALYRSHRKGK